MFYPLDFTFRRLWLPNRFKLWAREDILLEVTDSDGYNAFWKRKRSDSNCKKQ